jgi:hypothetical protein
MIQVHEAMMQMIEAGRAASEVACEWCEAVGPWDAWYVAAGVARAFCSADHAERWQQRARAQPPLSLVDPSAPGEGGPP